MSVKAGWYCEHCDDETVLEGETGGQCPTCGMPLVSVPEEEDGMLI